MVLARVVAPRLLLYADLATSQFRKYPIVKLWTEACVDARGRCFLPLR